MRNGRTQLELEGLNKETEKAIGYVRVSTDSQADHGHSIPDQKEKIKAYASAKGLELVDIFVDDGVSGTVEPSKREGLSQAITCLSENKADALIVVKNDRIARRASYQKDVIYGLVEAGKEYISISENVDTKSASGKLFLSLLAEFAEYEVELIRERTKSALTHLKNTGQAYTSSRFGYKKKGSKKDGDDKSLFVKDETEQAIINDIISLYDSGLSWQKVCNALAEKHNRKMFPNTARRIYLREKKRLMAEVA
ncbi:MAG: recombinase family protein [Spirochaetota bacterium]|nr:recombinase family protein [Spirochaetota bacterium]